MIPDNECPICGFETRRDGETVICHECGDVTDAVYDGFVVRLQDLDDSFDDDDNAGWLDG